MKPLSRRDILKLTAALVGGAVAASTRPLVNLARGQNKDRRPNFIVLVLDAMSARNLSLQGYARPTTPGFARLAERSTVYHNHYAGGNFTTPGAASIFTGVYPWTHRALLLSGLVERGMERENIFHFLGEEYTRAAFSHNPFVYLLLGQASRDVDVLLDRAAFSIRANRSFPDDRLLNDFPLGYYTFPEFLGASKTYTHPGSFTLGLAGILTNKKPDLEPTADYPRGYPNANHSTFRIEDVLEGLLGVLQDIASRQSPFFAYFHLLPPHSPYNPRREFLKPFAKDGFVPPSKPMHPLAVLNMTPEKLERQRVLYDSFIANVDFEVEQFVNALESSGVLDTSYLIVTSDHGEMFERGFYGHGSALMYEPVTHIPLIVHAPGQTGRRDVRSLTSSTDLVPTILSLAGKDIPSGLEGRILPGLGSEEDAERSVFTVFAKENSSFLPLEKSVMSMRKGRHKLIHYRGYPGYEDRLELYQLDEDPEELRDLSASDTVTARRMKEELLGLAAAADAPYQRAR